MARCPAGAARTKDDNLVIHRERLRALFGFDYRIECQVPAARRTCGFLPAAPVQGPARRPDRLRFAAFNACPLLDDEPVQALRSRSRSRSRSRAG